MKCAITKFLANVNSFEKYIHTIICKKVEKHLTFGKSTIPSHVLVIITPVLDYVLNQIDK